MELQELIRKFNEIGERKVVGAMVYYTNKSEDYKQVNYFFNPILQELDEDIPIEEYITRDLMDCVAFDSYHLGYGSESGEVKLFVTSHEEITYRELLSNEVADVVFFEIKELVLV